jgi:hypothetical protein
VADVDLMDIAAEQVLALLNGKSVTPNPIELPK